LVDAFDGVVARLKSVDLQGYKTFANRTDLVFSPTITAIVGPNGSGKSNIADAIRWVLGEQAYSILRGKKTEDMIFSGSEERPRSSMASVEITFDNADGWLPIEFSEVSIGRRAYRDGQNEYLLNGQRVRLRDVSELLAKCGLAERTYTIIGQGLVDAALSLRANERRQLFEEAAGIGLYRSRRDEALRRLDTTRRNLDRVQDILAELRPRLRSLERQVKRAKDYDLVKQDLNNALRQWYGFHWYKLIDRVQHARIEADAQELNRDDLRRHQDELGAQLRRTRERIDAVRHQLSDWNRQVADLYRQKEAAGRRLAVAQERTKGLTEQQALIRTELGTLEDERAKLAKQLEDSQAELDSRNQLLSEARVHLEGLLDQGAVSSHHRKEMQGEVEDLRRRMEELAAEQATRRAEASQIEAQITRLTAEIQAEQAAVNEAEEDVRSKHVQLEQARSDEQSAQQAVADAERHVAECEAKLAEAEEALNSWTGQLAERAGKFSALETRLEQFEAEGAEKERLVQQLDDQIAEGRLERLADQIKTDDSYHDAIQAALGEFAHPLALPSSERMLAALIWWEKHGGGEGVALLPADEIRQPPAFDLPSDVDVIGLAADMVSVASRLKSVAELLLGRVVIVRDRKAARRLLDQVPYDVRLVTLNGEVHYPGGQAVVGKSEAEIRRSLIRSQMEDDITVSRKGVKEAEKGQSEAAALVEKLQVALKDARSAVEDGRQAELQARADLQSRQLVVAESQREADRRNERQSKVQSELSGYQDQQLALNDLAPEFEKRRDQLERSLSALMEKLQQAETSVEVTRAEAAIEAAQQAVADAAGPVQNLDGRLRDLDQEVVAWGTRLDKSKEEERLLEAQIQAASQEDRQVEIKLEELQKLIEPAQGSLVDAETQRSSLEDEDSSTRTESTQAERVHSQAQIELARREEELSSMRRRIEDDFGLVTFDEDETPASQEPLPLTGLVERLPRVSSIPDELEGQVNRLRVQLRRMGSVNPEARREHREVKERTEFLVSQVEDLRQAEGQIQEVIAELDLLMEREFRKTFDEVAIAFREVFTRLFGGGSARLVLTNPDNLTDSGIDIEARLPGRRAQGLAVLSGGERSLTASALIFALLKVAPTPFCLLDEVDAMLDEANVLRFGEVLAELSQQTQFIVITHNRQTVQAAEAIYGVTMGDDSVSRLISLKLDEYEKEMVEV
jgi:chromosome segregation protein